ncbi:zinc knuckle CX2CX4HX4C containing protein [Tanacetum coccineum]
MQELREDTFSKNKNDDAHEHVERVLDIVSLFNILRVSHDVVMLHVFPITLTGTATRLVDRLPSANRRSLTRKPRSRHEEVERKCSCYLSRMSNLQWSSLDKDCPLNEEVLRSSPESSTPKEQDPRSFILTCSIGKLDFNNALADLGASISIMPLSMYKHLGIGKLELINMVIEMADNTKCTPKGIVENLLIKIDKFIFPVDFVILDMVEDLRMPIILGRPLLASAHAKVDIFRKSISLEAGSEKVIFKMRSSFATTNFASARSIKSKTRLEDDDFKKIDYDLFLYDSELCEFNRLLSIDPDICSYEIDIHESYEEIVYRITKVEKEKRVHWCKAILQEKENERKYWASCNPYSNVCDGGVCKMTRERILKDHWNKTFRNEEDDLEENLEDPKECGEDKANTIMGVIHDKLHDDWFNNTSEDEDDLEGILDNLKPRSYDGFINLDDEAYNKRRCKWLGMTYEEPTPILIEKVKVTRYSVGLSEIYTKVKVLLDNVAAMRARLMKKMAHEGNVHVKK